MRLERSETGHYRGLHIAIVDPSKGTGRPWCAKVFDTYKSSEALEELLDSGIPEGHVVIAACKDECASHMSKAVKHWFKSMGSTQIDYIQYRQGFAFIGVSGGTDCIEELAQYKNSRVSVTRVFRMKKKFYTTHPEEDLHCQDILGDFIKKIKSTLRQVISEDASI